MKKVELLAPAGSIEAFHAAINAGCNAVYLGGVKFGARSYANNFSLEDFKEILEYARLYNTKVYCTVNTVIFEDEINEAIEFIGEIHKLGIDAVLIQDYGLLNIIHKIYPNLVLHASTQMNTTTLEEVKVLKEMGVSRVVLARETDISEIRRIKENIDIEIEVFVHGAICISYSGNCYMSSIITKRSGNRGKCSGSCRLEYKLISDDGYDEKFNYPLSSKDLMTLDNINELIECGVDSLKIEGRMKRAEYVGQVVQSYRKIIDQKCESVDKEKKKLKLIFNRGFSKGFILKDKNSQIINSNQPNHIGVNVGKVIKAYPNGTVDILLEDDICFGDSLRIVGQSTDAITINQVKVKGNLKKEAFKNEVINVKVHEQHAQKLMKGIVYKTTDKKQLDEISKLPPPLIEITGEVYLNKNMLVFSITDGKYTVSKKIEIDDLSNNSYNQRIINQLKKCGPIYKMVNLVNKLDEEVFIQVSKINALRRECLDALTALRKKNNTPYEKVDFDFSKLNLQRNDLHLTVRVRTKEQIEAALSCGVKNLYISDYNLFKEYENIKNGDNSVYYYPPRIGNICKANNLVTSSINSYNLNNNTSIYSNCCNSYTLRMMAEKVNSVGLSLELNYERLKMMIDAYLVKYQTLPNLEMFVYGRYELMVMKYCVINDKVIHDDKLYCNECLKHNYSLIDKSGYSFPLIREENCNLRLLNSKITNLINYLPKILELKVNSLLLDFILEDASEVKKIISEYQERLNNLDSNYNKNLNSFTSGHFNEGVL